MPFPTPALGEPFFIPLGPLTTSEIVKRTMLRDWGIWEDEFRVVAHDIGARLLAALGSSKPRDGKDGDLLSRRAEMQANLAITHVVAGMRDLGIKTLPDERWLSPAIATFFCSASPAFDFNKFHTPMKKTLLYARASLHWLKASA